MSVEAAGVACGGLSAEAMVAGRLVRLPKHSPVFQLYGALEEAEARIGLARARTRDPVLGEALLLAERLVRAALHVVATGEAGVAGRLLEEAKRAALGLPEPRGWSLAGCSVEEAEAAIASAKAREAERLVSALVEEGVLPPEVGEAAAGLLSAASLILYRVRWGLCGGRGNWSSSSLSLVLGGAN